MLDRLNSKIITNYEIKLNIFEIESKEDNRNIKLDYNDKDSFYAFEKDINRAYYGYYKPRGIRCKIKMGEDIEDTNYIYQFVYTFQKGEEAGSTINVFCR